MMLRVKWKGLWLLLLFHIFAQRLPAREQSWLTNFYGSLDASRDTAIIAPLIRRSYLLQSTDVDIAIALSRKALAYSRMKGFTQGTALSLIHLSFLVATYKRDVALTDRYLAEALPFLQQLPEHRRGRPIVNYYRIKAYSFVLRSQIDSCAYYYNQALHVIATYRLGNTELPYSLYIELSNVYNNNKQPEKALFYLKKAEPLITDETDIIPLYENFATTYIFTGNHQEAEQYALKGLDLLKKYTASGYEHTKSTFYFRLGQARAAKHPGEAIALHKMALAEDRNIPIAFRAMEEYQSLADLYYRTGDYRNAEASLYKAIQSVQKEQLGQDPLGPSYTLLYRLYSGPIPNYRLAYHYRDLAARIDDSTRRKEKQEIINNLEIRYRTLEKDKELHQKQLLLIEKNKEITQNQLLLVRKNFWITSVALSTFLLALLLAMVYRNARHRQKLQLKTMNTLQREKEISNLKSVIAGEEKERQRLGRDLHDGVMVLFSAIRMKISQLPRAHKSTSGDTAIPDLDTQMECAIKELRRTAHNLMPDMLLEGGLAEAIFYFCESLQQHATLELTYQQYGALPRLPGEQELSLYRIVQELVQNVMKHATATRALVQLNYRDCMLSITVEDNGCGFDPKVADRHNKMGLKSIRARLDALNGSMDICSNTAGTTVYLELEIHPILEPRQ